MTVLSNCFGPEPLNSVERFSCKLSKKVTIAQPKPITYYNQAMGGVDLLESSIADYRISIHGKKWWWPHFINTLGVLMGAAWKVHQAVNPDANPALLSFIRAVVSRNLHCKACDSLSPQHWKCGPCL